MANEPRRTQAQQERRIRILETAMRMAGEGGYEAVQMRAVAEESGVAPGTIYRYYSGKDEMLIAGLAGWLRRTRRRVESGLACRRHAGRPTHLLARAFRCAYPKPAHADGCLIRALGTTLPAAIEHKLEVDTYPGAGRHGARS